MSKRLNLSPLLYTALFLSLVILLLLWRLFFKEVNFYVPSAILLIASMLPFFFRFEKNEKSAREITITASLIALAVVSRAVFYLIPQVKPIAAVVIVSAVCLGAERGFFVGAFSAFISNFIFGQGLWTPFQMAALGLVGLIAGIVLKNSHGRIKLAVTGFILASLLYGVIVDLSTILAMYGSNITLSGVLSVYVAGVPFSLAFGISTAVFLFLFGEGLISKINRVITKYEIIKKTD